MIHFQILNTNICSFRELKYSIRRQVSLFYTDRSLTKQEIKIKFASHKDFINK